jgi:hypothetical protein
VIRIRTADVFSQKDKDGRAMAAARQVINQFEEEETRQAQLTGDQLKLLRGSRRDSSQLAAPPAPRSKRGTDEPTTARPPLHSEEVSTIAGRGMPKGMSPSGFEDGEEATRLVAPTNRRTPVPERVKPRAATVPPPLPGMTQPKTRPRADPNPPIGELPSTVHQRNPKLQSIGGPPSMPGGPPAMPPELAHAPTGFDEAAPIPGTSHIRSGQPGLPPPQQQLPAMQQLPMQPPVLQPPSMGQVQPGVIRTPQPGQLPPQPMQQQPMLPPPMQNPMQPMQPRVTPLPLPQQNPYGMWGGPPPQHQQPMQQRHSAPPTSPGPNRKTALQPWMLVVGALVMAALAFAITRAFISG